MPDDEIPKRAILAAARIAEEIMETISEEADRSNVPIYAVEYYLWGMISGNLMITGFDVLDLQESLAARFADGVRQGFIEAKGEG